MGQSRRKLQRQDDRALQRLAPRHIDAPRSRSSPDAAEERSDAGGGLLGPPPASGDENDEESP